MSLTTQENTESQGGKPPCFGMWRSLVARLFGGQKVAGSSPAIPTENRGQLSCLAGSGLVRWVKPIGEAPPCDGGCSGFESRHLP